MMSILGEEPGTGEPSDLTGRIAANVRALRTERGYSLDALAARSGVSRSAISTIERGATSPTAVVLEKLATALSVPLGWLFEPTEGPEKPSPLVRRADQARWRDPGSGYVRRAVSPPHWPSPIRITEVDFPAGAVVAYETAERDPSVFQQIWVLAGTIKVTLGPESYRLETGDCLAMRLQQPITYRNPTARAARYAVVNVSEPVAARRSA